MILLGLMRLCSKMIYGSVCSGIEAASVAWHPLGWRAAFLSEIEAFPRAVLQHHYPAAPLHGDFTTIKENDYEAINLLVGGTPCQSFSVAGLRGGMADERGNLALEYLRLAERLRPRWLLWENVPGVLSSNGGRDFGSFLGGLGQLGYGFAYRVLDAQYFGLAQRRKRVFVVGYFGDWRRAAAVLFEPASLRGHPAPRRETREGAAASTQGCTAFGGNNTAGPINVATAVNAHGGPHGRLDSESETFIAHQQAPLGITIHGTDPTVQKIASYDDLAQCLRARTPGNIDNSSTTVVQQPYTLAIRGRGDSHDLEYRQDGTVGAVAFQSKASASQSFTPSAIAPTLDVGKSDGLAAQIGAAVRRLMPREAERLQGFEDDYTLIPYRGKLAADGPRYRALGNSFAVPVVRWIGKRIAVEQARMEQKEIAA